MSATAATEAATQDACREVGERRKEGRKEKRREIEFQIPSSVSLARGDGRRSEVRGSWTGISR